MSKKNPQRANRIQQMATNPNYFRDAQERARQDVIAERRSGLPRRRPA